MNDIRTHYDNLIIGFGKGGKTLAAYLAGQGQRVALIERSENMYGGSCINIACIPTKSLIVNAEKKIPYEIAYEEKNELTSFLRQQNYDKLDNLSSATVITGRTAFISSKEIRIHLNESNKEVTVSADRIFINTGTEPFIPSIPGLDSSKRIFTSTTLMEQSVLVKKLIVIGGGYVGLEFADMYAKYGAEVIVIDNNELFLPREDRDIADEIFKVLTAKGITILTGASVQKIWDKDPGSVSLEYRSKDGELIKIDAAAILLATGRKPVQEELNLAAAGVETDKRGFIQVDEFLRTNVPHIWAIGDINGGPQFTYISLDDFRIIRDQLDGGPYNSVKMRKHYATSVFITPQLAHIGLREKEAIEKGLDIKVAKLPAAGIPRARILNNTAGFLKAIVDAKSNKIVGCTLFCVEANEMINVIKIAMDANADYQLVRDAIYTHPSMAEAFNDLYAGF